MANKTELFIQKIQATNWSQIDLSDTVTFPITFNIADVRQINNRNGAYSKTLSIPGTKNNTEVFENIFDIQAIDSYNTRVKVKCSVVVDTVPVLEGYLQLDKIKCDENNYWIYECIIFGENSNFVKEIDPNALLNELDFSEFNHDYNVQSITQSWIKDWSAGYYYPLIDYNTLRNPDNSAGSNRWLTDNFKPAIYVKQYLNKIFQNIGYTYESNFFNSPEFENLIIPATNPVLENDELWRWNASYKVGLTQSVNFFTLFGWQRATNPTVGSNFASFLNIIPNITTATPIILDNSLPMSEFIIGGYNPNNNFTGPPEIRYTYNYQTQYNRRQTLVLNVDYQITATFSNGAAYSENQIQGSRLIVVCEIFKNNSFLSRQTLDQFGTSENPYDSGVDIILNNLLNSIYGEVQEDWSPVSFERRNRQVSIDFEEGELQAGDNIDFRIRAIHCRIIDVGALGLTSLQQQTNYFNTGFTFDFFSTTNGTNGTQFYNFIDPVLLSRQPFALNQAIPKNIKQIDFINSIIKMFNLYLYQDKINPKKIIIEPRDDFYFQTSTNWTNKLDISKDIQQTPIVDRKKRVLLTYKEDKDYYNSFYKGIYNEVYGQYQYNTGYEFETSEQKIDVIFSATPLAWRKVNDNTFDPAYIYTQFLQATQPTTSSGETNIETNIRILYRKNVDIPRATKFKFLDRGVTPLVFYRFDTYPYAGHLDDPFNPKLDLSFYRPNQLFYIATDFGYTDNNLFNVYYKNFFDEIYGPESKSITAYFYLTPQDILEFDYRRLIYIENMSSGSPGYYRINKIEYDPNIKQSYKVELIKVLNDFEPRYRKELKPPSGGGKPVDNIFDTVRPGDVTTNVKPPGGGTILGDNNITGGVKNTIDGNSNVIAGVDNSVRNPSSENNVIAGDSNTILGRNNFVSGSQNSVTSKNSSIIAGASNSVSTERSVIIGGYNNYISYRDNGDSSIIGGSFNTIGKYPGTVSLQSETSIIIGGYKNTIQTGTSQSSTKNTFILGGQNNTIAAGVTNSFILNGNGVTLTQSNTVYIDGTLIVNGTPITGGGSQGPTGPAGPTGSVGPTGPGGDGLFEEIVVGNRHYIQLISSTPSTDFYYLGSDASVCGKPFTGLIIMTAANPTFTGFIVDNAGKNLISNSLTNVDILGSTNNVTGDRSTFISSKRSDIVGTSDFGSIISSQYGYIRNSNKSNIISSNGYSPAYTSCISTSKYSNIQSQSKGLIDNSCYSSIIGGLINEVCNSMASVIIGSRGSTICLGDKSTILGGISNLSKCGLYSSIVGGYSNCIYISYSSSILGGQNNKIYTNSNQSTIVGGYQNTIDCSNKSSIISGDNNFICSTIGTNAQLSIISSAASYLGYCSINSAIISSNGSTMSCSQRSVILGGQNLVLNTQDDTILVPNLWIAGSLSPDSGITNGLTQDVSVSGTTFSFCNGVLTAVIV